MMLVFELGFSLPRNSCMVWRLGKSATEASGDCYGYLVCAERMDTAMRSLASSFLQSVALAS